MHPSKSFVVRIAIYSLLILYIAGDLFVFKGPIHKRLRSSAPDSPQSIAAAKAHGMVARVYGKPIVASQLERAVADRLRLQGRQAAGLTPEQLKMLRYAALNDLIDHQILRVKTKANAGDAQVSEEEIDAEMARFASRFDSDEERMAAMTAQGISGEKEMRLRIGGRLQQEKYIASRVVPPTTVTEQQAREWYDDHQQQMVRPERIRARHVFIATLERDPAEAREILAKALERLQKGEVEFAALATELSEDERSKPAGGELGWFSRDRLAADFTAATFALPAKTPSLFRTKLGWHLGEVIERQPAGPVPFEQARDGIIAAIESVFREQAVGNFRDGLRKMEKSNIHVYRDIIDAL